MDIKELMKKQDLTDEEYEALSDEFARNPPKLDPYSIGWLTERELYRLGLNNASVQYLCVRARNEKKRPLEIVNEMIMEKIYADCEPVSHKLVANM